MIMKKKILTTLLITTLALSMTACGTKTAEVPEATETVEVTEVTEVAEVETEVTETEEVTEDTEVTEETETTEVTEATEVAEVPAFTVTEMSAIKYAKSSVNVRKGPASDYEKLGGLSTNQKVTVTGQADTGWYRIEYNGTEGYVSDKYLVDQKVATSTSNTSTSTNTNTNTTANTTTTTDTNAATTTTDNTQQQTNTAPTDNGGSTWTGDTGNTGNTSAPVDNTASAPADTGSTGTVIDGSGMSLEDLDALTGGGGFGDITQGGAENAGIGGDWGHIE